MATVLTLFALFVMYTYINLSFSPVKDMDDEPSAISRGSIVDKNGSPLAVQINFYNIGVTPRLMKRIDINDFAASVAPLLDMSAQSVLNLINEKNDTAPGGSFFYLKKKVTETKALALKELAQNEHYTFMTFDKVPGRFYPENRLASSLIGFMGNDGVGLSGIEYSMQDYLRSTNSEDPTATHFKKLDSSDDEDAQSADTPPSDEASASSNGQKSAPSQYQNIFLTIDSLLQYKLERIAREKMEETQCESMMMLAADATNGEILSYISLPAADLNEYTQASDEEKMDLPAVMMYEPGSVFKVFTVAAAFDAGFLSKDEKFLCDGVYTKRVGKGEIIRIKCLEHHGSVTASDALRLSCNDALAQIAEKMDDEYFLRRIRDFGFGRKTEIELPSESEGLLKDTQSAMWSARSKPTMAIGQELSVTALQILHAATAIANDGVPLRLTVIKKITNKDSSTLYEHERMAERQSMSARTARYIRECMLDVATRGTGMKARLDGVEIGVKTGTAQMYDGKGGYSDTDFLSNCLAIFPIDDPKIILYIVVVKAKGETYAGRIVAPIISLAADEIIDHLGIRRSDAPALNHTGQILLSPSPIAHINFGDGAPDFSGYSISDIRHFINENEIVKNSDIRVIINGQGWVKDQSPEVGTPLSKGDTIELNLSLE